MGWRGLGTAAALGRWAGWCCRGTPSRGCGGRPTCTSASSRPSPSSAGQTVSTRTPHALLDLLLACSLLVLPPPPPPRHAWIFQASDTAQSSHQFVATVTTLTAACMLTQISQKTLEHLTASLLHDDHCTHGVPPINSFTDHVFFLLIVYCIRSFFSLILVAITTSVSVVLCAANRGDAQVSAAADGNERAHLVPLEESPPGTHTYYYYYFDLRCCACIAFSGDVSPLLSCW